MRLWIDTALNYAVPWVDNNSRRIITIAKPIITKTVAGAIGFAAHCHPTGSVSACRANRIDRAADRVARTAESRENPVRVKSNLLNRIKLIWVVPCCGDSALNSLGGRRSHVRSGGAGRNRGRPTDNCKFLDAIERKTRRVLDPTKIRTEAAQRRTIKCTVTVTGTGV